MLQPPDNLTLCPFCGCEGEANWPCDECDQEVACWNCERKHFEGVVPGPLLQECVEDRLCLRHYWQKLKGAAA